MEKSDLFGVFTVKTQFSRGLFTLLCLFLMKIMRFATAAGVTPEIRDAWPMFSGRVSESFPFISFESPGTD
jgi:hypothetical protein